MRNKPWFVCFIALCHIFEPLFSWLILETFFDISWLELLITTFEEGRYLRLWTFFLFPIAGFVILAYKKWSLPIFWLIELIALVVNTNFLVQVWNQEMYNVFFGSLFLFTLNLVVTTYSLLPIVRKSFTDYSLHWWNNKKRFTLNVPGSMLQNDKAHSIELVNVSESGLFAKMETEEQVELSKEVGVEFEYEGMNFSLTALPVHFNEQHRGYGLQLTQLTKTHKKELKSLVKLLKKKGLITARDSITVYDELIEWIKSPAKLTNLLPKIRR